MLRASRSSFVKTSISWPADDPLTTLSRRDDLSSAGHCRVEPVQLEGERDIDDPRENRIGADHPDQSQSADTWPDDKDGTEQDRQHAAQDQQPFVVDLFAQSDGPDDLEHTGGDRPAGYEVEENDRGDA